MIRKILLPILALALFCAASARAQSLPSACAHVIRNGGTLPGQPDPAAPVSMGPGLFRAVALAPYQFAIPTGCTPAWIIKYDCTVQVFTGALATQISWPNMGFATQVLGPNSSQMFHWTDTIQVVEGQPITGPLCGMSTSLPVTVAGGLVVEALPNFPVAAPRPRPAADDTGPAAVGTGASQ